jgi:hypothetical protein
VGQEVRLGSRGQGCAGLLYFFLRFFKSVSKNLKGGRDLYPINKKTDVTPNNKCMQSLVGCGATL